MIDTINARSAAPHLSVQSAQAQADAFLQALTDTAAAKGVALVARGSVVAASQFPDWPTKLAEALCADPSLAGQSNQTLAAVIEARSGKTGFNSKLLSKTLSNLQRSYAVGVLERHGYATATLAKGTDIKRIVRDNVRVATTEALEASTVEIKTTFYADGLSIDSRPYQYRQRQTTPTGNPWYGWRRHTATNGTGATRSRRRGVPHQGRSGAGGGNLRTGTAAYRARSGIQGTPQPVWSPVSGPRHGPASQTALGAGSPDRRQRLFVSFLLGMRNCVGGLVAPLDAVVDRWIEAACPGTRSTDKARKRKQLRSIIERRKLMANDTIS
jgi:hypothetical protein